MSAPVEAIPEVLPEDVIVQEVLWESLSIPAIYEEIYGASMSIPEGWTPEDAGFMPSETGSGYVEPPEADDTPATDDVPESDDVPPSSASAVSAAVAGACVVAAMALF